MMQFAMRSATNCLATPDNLKRWKKASSDNCKMCSKSNSRPRKATLFHILNHCEAFLGEKERMTWRHDSILSYMVQTLKENTLPSIPQNILVTSSRPDLVVIDNSPLNPTVYLFELTVCFERAENIEAANSRKYERYSALVEDIKEMGYQCKNIPFEVGSRGHLTLENKSRLAILHKLCNPKTTFTRFWQNMTKTSLLCSYSIYLSRNEDTWTEIPFLLPVRKQ
jgi:hypothetical protein